MFVFEPRALVVTFRTLHGIGPGYLEGLSQIVSAFPLDNSKVGQIQVSSIKQCYFVTTGITALLLHALPFGMKSLWRFA